MGPPTDVAALLEIGARVLSDSTHIFDDHDTQAEAEELLAHALGVSVDDLDDDLRPSSRSAERYLSLIARRAAGEPFPFLTGHIEFWGLDLRVRPGPFVPRPSSELLVARAAKLIARRKDPILVDVCTGSGPIAIALGDEFPDAEIWGTDIDADGIALGRANARRLGIGNVNLRTGDMYGALPGRLRGAVDVITGHVPYVPVDEIDDLPSEVKDFEPVHTLSDESSQDGLALMRYAVDNAMGWLKPGGWLLLEVSEDMAVKIRRLCRKAGFKDKGVASDADRLSVVVESRAPR